MPGRLPVASDFPSSLTLSITPPPSPQNATNVLILLHGLGDSCNPFTSMAKQMALPETVCLSIQAPTPLPFNLGGFHWGDDILFNQAIGKMDLDTGFERAKTLLGRDVIQRVLIDKCNYQPREILLFGFGQGGMAALAVAAAAEIPGELGGVISVGGPLPSSFISPIPTEVTPKKDKTPLLVLGGKSATLITPAAVSKIKDLFEFVEHVTFARPGDAMPGSREEMLPLMSFLARRLRSRQGVPSGSVELG